ncbi:hypothetical protein ACFVX3_33095 [Rhodococcus erythropolis]
MRGNSRRHRRQRTGLALHAVSHRWGRDQLTAVLPVDLAPWFEECVDSLTGL